MGSVAFINTLFWPEQEDIKTFEMLQGEYAYFRQQLNRDEPDLYWRVVRVETMANALRDKFFIVKTD